MPATLRALLAGAIDYAGMFPPANLALEAALQDHARYLETAEAWMLGAFVLPVAQFAAAMPRIAQLHREPPLRVAALGRKTSNVADFLEAVKTAAREIEALSRDGDKVTVTQLEMPLPNDALNADVLTGARAALAHLQLNAFWEAPADSADAAIRLLAEHNASAAGRPFGFKLRTGGVTAVAFPASSSIARALVAAIQHRVPIKFTAGLHHPVRKFHESVGTVMPGFLNVLGAGVLAAEHSWDAAQTTALLDEEEPAAFRIEEERFAWREWKIGPAQIQRHRELVTSFGSCSFDEPRDDLRALHLL